MIKNTSLTIPKNFGKDLETMVLYEKLYTLQNEYNKNPSKENLEIIEIFILENSDVFHKNYLSRLKRVLKLTVEKKFDEIFKIKQEQLNEIAALEKQKFKLEGELRLKHYLEEIDAKHKEDMEQMITEVGTKNMAKSSEFILSVIKEFSDNIDKLRMQFGEGYLEKKEGLEKFKIDPKLYNTLLESLCKEMDDNMDYIQKFYEKFKEKAFIWSKL
jgi:hypothetical protein